jgi:hypothetical protein
MHSAAEAAGQCRIMRFGVHMPADNAIIQDFNVIHH